MTGECILAIDLGTSGPKVALVTTQGEVLASEVESTELFLSEGGGAERAFVEPCPGIGEPAPVAAEHRRRSLGPVGGIGGALGPR